VLQRVRRLSAVEQDLRQHELRLGERGGRLNPEEREVGLRALPRSLRMRASSRSDARRRGWSML
jgi:hypothetical protein